MKKFFIRIEHRRRMGRLELENKDDFHKMIYEGIDRREKLYYFETPWTPSNIIGIKDCIILTGRINKNDKHETSNHKKIHIIDNAEILENVGSKLN